MNKKPLILGIESSCDETAASLITENEQGIPIVLSNIISSQVEVHKEFGGVVPELAARSHMEKIDLIVQKAISESGRKIEEIDAVASTAGPGLIFETLPVAFYSLPMGAFFSIIFFVLITIAALSSAISLLEPFTAWMEELLKIKRKIIVIFIGLFVWFLGIGSIFSFNIWVLFNSIKYS